MSPVEPDPSKGLNGAVAGELRAMKARRNATNEMISEASEIPLVSVNRYLAGKRQINLAILSELARALGADPDRILKSAIKELEQAEDGGGDGESEAPMHRVTLTPVKRLLKITDADLPVGQELD